MTPKQEFLLWLHYSMGFWSDTTARSLVSSL